MPIAHSDHAHRVQSKQTLAEVTVRKAFKADPSFLRLVLAVLLGAAILTAPASARDPRWRAFGPGGGTVTGLTTDPQDPQVVYAATFRDLYGSRDGGQTWRGFSLPPPINAVAVAPGRPTTLYTGGAKILRSGDGGRSWRTVLDEPFLDVHALAVTTGHRPVVFALSQNAVRRSADDGQTWTTPLTSDGQIDSLAVDPITPAIAYVADRNGVFRSSDSGLSWTRILELDASAPVLVAVAPSSPRTLYVVAGLSIPGFTVFRSSNSGETWTRVRDREGSFDRALVVDPGSPTKLYLAGLDGVLGSFDGGRVWIPLDGGMPKGQLGESPSAFSLAFAPRQRRTLFAGLYELGVARSDNSGGTWAIPVQTGLGVATYSSLFFNPLRPGEELVALGSAGDRVLRSADDGSTWSFLPRRIARLGLHAMAFDVADPDLFYAATNEGVWRTRDDGATWSKLTAEAVYRLATAGPDELLASGYCGMNRSRDGGLTWETALPCAYDDFLSQGVGRLWVDPSAPDAIYVLVTLFSDTHPYGTLILASRDRGVTWRQLEVANPFLFEVAPGSSRVLYTADPGGPIKRSQDGGLTWQKMHDQLSSDEPFSSLAIDAQDPNTIYLATPRRILRSRDGGQTLEVLDPDFSASLTTDRARPGLLFAGTFQAGLFELQVE
ncbi:MAG TPA: hypothetical protein VLV54_07245 [Thermoanaerobaculia bacterium]|nr:hypothetical protein [Thermoanaerobaculia bacterium]